MWFLVFPKCWGIARNQKPHQSIGFFDVKGKTNEQTTNNLLKVIADKQKDVAYEYQKGFNDRTDIDWSQANNAIIER